MVLLGRCLLHESAHGALGKFFEFFFLCVMFAGGSVSPKCLAPRSQTWIRRGLDRRTVVFVVDGGHVDGTLRPRLYEHFTEGDAGTGGLLRYSVLTSTPRPWWLLSDGILTPFFRRLMNGDHAIGRGSRQRSLTKSVYCNNCKVAAHDRSMALQVRKRF